MGTLHILSRPTAGKAQTKLCEFRLVVISIFRNKNLTGTREDTWQLAQFLPDFTGITAASADELKLLKLKAVFEAFAQKRYPRTTKITTLSKNVGDLKCPGTPEGEQLRAKYFETMKFNGAVGSKMQDELFGGPF